MSRDPDDLPQGGRHDDQVGYGKPPLKRRFKTSGNPSGRPKGAKNRETIVRQVAQEMHTVIENGQRNRRSTLDLVLIRLRNMAMTGEKPQATSEMFRLLEKHEPGMVNAERRRNGCASADFAGGVACPGEARQCSYGGTWFSKLSAGC